jgi:hypothetical protein
VKPTFFESKKNGAFNFISASLCCACQALLSLKAKLQSSAFFESTQRKAIIEKNWQPGSENTAILPAESWFTPRKGFR